MELSHNLFIYFFKLRDQQKWHYCLKIMHFILAAK